ncbi:hypothetical protein FJ987_04705 [Mesorhizobium sp. CU2]|nr:hypothetical protein FJ988_07580 [Mesorhizobium sp. CU3]TPO20441.1 hypothetical protein FJ987_04705 [Mesorhizobium sp. CU2]
MPQCPPKNDRLAALLRRQFSNKMMRRYLRSLPLFKIEGWLPDQLRELMERLKKKPHKRRH